MKEKIFYHIHKIQNSNAEKSWKVGNRINVGKEYNYFFKLAREFEPKFSEIDNVQNVPWDNVYEHYKINCQLTEEKSYMLLENASRIISEYQMLIREIVYEDVRKKEFSHLPSRQRCIWLCKEEQLEFWKSNIGGAFKIFKVKIEGNTFKSNNDLIVAPSESYNKIVEMAKKYWSYNRKIENEKDEYLYIGSLEILEELKGG